MLHATMRLYHLRAAALLSIEGPTCRACVWMQTSSAVIELRPGARLPGARLTMAVEAGPGSWCNSVSRRAHTDCDTACSAAECSRSTSLAAAANACACRGGIIDNIFNLSGFHMHSSRAVSMHMRPGVNLQAWIRRMQGGAVQRHHIHEGVQLHPQLACTPCKY